MKLSVWKTIGLCVCAAFVAIPSLGSAAGMTAEENVKSIAAKTTSTVTGQPFTIKVVDDETGRGIPLVELTTTNKIKLYTDSAGYVAFNEPGLMNQSVFFSLFSHGYQVEPDFFGNRGQAVDVVPGGSVTLTMERVNIAERLYRMTGQGIYRDSVMLGLGTPIEEPVLNGKVMGSDSVQTIKYKNKLYWFWGDTDRPAYPLGNFRVTGATSELPGSGGLDPDVGVNLSYFTKEDGFVKSLVPPLPDGAGIAWIFGLMTAKDATGKERLLAGYSTHNPDLTAFGILAFNDEQQEFEQLVQFPSKDDWRHPGGQATYYEENGQGYWVFTEHKMPNLRVPNSLAAITDYTQYEAFTCLTPGTVYNGAGTSIERDATGKPVWGWKLNTPPLKQSEEKELLRLGVLAPSDPVYFQLKDVDTGNEVELAMSTVEWNDYRQKYVMIGQQVGGTSSGLGEIWFAEAAKPQGPWTTAKKIVTHANYTFYNPAHDEFFDKDGGRILYFEGTYTNTFTSAEPTPRYNYNQILYKLNLDDPKLGLPLAPTPIPAPANP